MKRSLGLLSLCGWIVVSLAATSRAQTSSVDHYRFLPRLSVLNQSGGIGGFDVDFRVTYSTHVITAPTRQRKLLLHRAEIDRLVGAVEREGYTLIPLELYWKAGRAKLRVGLAKGKKQHDKRATEKERDWQRDKARLMRGR